MDHEMKDMLEIAVANNDSLWEGEVIDRLQDELERLYNQEEKAKSYTELVSQISAVDEIVATNYDKDMTDTNLHLLMLGAEVKRFFESSEADEL